MGGGGGGGEWCQCSEFWIEMSHFGIQFYF